MSTFQNRCALAEQCLPKAGYRALLEKLHLEMLSELAASQAQVAELQRTQFQTLGELHEQMDALERELAAERELCINATKRPPGWWNADQLRVAEEIRAAIKAGGA